MAMKDSSRSLIPANPTMAPTTLQLGQTTQVDLSWMPEEERRALVTEYTRGLLDVARRANNLGIEVSVLRSTLGALAETTNKVSLAGDAVTITHVQTTPVGRTEVMMGNTEAATKGKLTRSQTGEFNWAPVYVIVGVVALVLVASITMHR
jgi:hypothetical protein